MYSLNTFASQVQEPHLFMGAVPAVPATSRHMLLEDLSWNLLKYLHPQALMTFNDRYQTTHGEWCADFVLTTPQARVGIMIVSDQDNTPSPFMMAELIWGGKLDSIYVLRERDIYFHLHDVLFLIGKQHVNLFNERGRINLDKLVTQETRFAQVPYLAERIRIVFPLDQEDETGERQYWPANASAEHELQMLRYHKAATKRYLQPVYAFAA